MITHDADLADQLPRQIQMLDGRVVADTASGSGSRSAPVDDTNGSVP
jgi:putative ABC transport system ATP-binding protein